MKVFIEHVFAMSPAEYASLYFDEPFAIELCASVKLGRTLLRLDRAADRVVRHVRCEPVREIPAPLSKLLEGRGFHYLEEIDFDLRALRGRWRVIPSLFPERVEASGTLDFDEAAGGVNRVVRGEVNIAVFGIGGVVERFVVADVRKSYDEASAYTKAFLERRRS